MYNPLFSINSYDADGDITDAGIFIHLDSIILKFKDSSELGKFANDLLNMIPEIKGNEENL